MDPKYVQQNASDTPAYCNNPDFDYVYSDSWNYENNQCVDRSVNEIFSKRRRTPRRVLDDHLHHYDNFTKQKCNFTSQACTGQSGIIGKNQNFFFVKHIEDFQIAAQISAKFLR